MELWLPALGHLCGHGGENVHVVEVTVAMLKEDSKQDKCCALAERLEEATPALKDVPAVSWRLHAQPITTPPHTSPFTP